MDENNINPNQPTVPTVQPTVEQTSPDVSNPVDQQEKSISLSANESLTSKEEDSKKLLIVLLIFAVISVIGAGIYLYLQNQKQKPEITQTPIPNQEPLSPTPDPTLEWKNYMDDVNGFEFKYPTDYSINEDEGTIIVSSPSRSCRVKSDVSPEDSPYPNLFTYKPTSEVTFKITPREGKNFSEIWKESYGYDFFEEEHSERTVGGKRAYYISQGAEMSFSRTMFLVEIEETRALQIEVYLPIYQFECENPAYEFSQNRKYDLISHQILSTFKFIDIKTFNGKDSYTNKELGFSFKPPDGWNLHGESNPLQFINYIPAPNEGRDYDPELDDRKLKLEIYYETALEDLHSYVAKKKNQQIKEVGEETLWIETSIVLDGQEAIKVTTEWYGIRFFNIYVIHPGKKILFTLSFGLDFNDHQSVMNQILSTFKFSDNYPSSYTCPENGWVNCQPILTEEEQKACAQEAFDWYEENCPNYEGVAY